MADGSNPAFALAIAQAIARGQGTPQQRSAFNSAVAQQMQANAVAQQALHGGQPAPPGAAGFQPHPIGPAFPGQGHPQMPLPSPNGNQGGLVPLPGPHPIAPQGPVQESVPQLPTGGAGLAPPNPGGGLHQGVNPGGPMQQAPGSALPIGRTGPVRPIGPAWPPRRGTTQIGGRTYGTTTFNGHPVGF